MRNVHGKINTEYTTFVTVSRLVKQKAIDRFIRIHKKIIDEGLFHIVYIIGEGEERQNLENLTKKLKVQNTFIFLGKKENPYPYIKMANYFALLSYYEGYGMVVEEAKVLGKKIIITNTAAVEAVQGYKDSTIIDNDEDSIYMKMKEILQKKEKLNKKEQPFLSILTATYNREKYLPRLYQSIVNNIKENNIQIEWIIIDDGSTDNTKKIVKEWQNCEIKNLKIKYIYQQNLGKMAAINNGIKIATGVLTVDCDSDDYFTNDAFKSIKINASRLLKNHKFYALCFLKKDLKGDISGKRFKKDFMESKMFDLYFKEDIGGEKILVFNTDIRRNYKHELVKEEKFITEARMYHKMDKDRSIICINNAIEIGDYIQDGYTKNILETFKRYPCGYFEYFKELLLKKMTLKKKVYVIKHFFYFGIKKIREVLK